MPKTEIAVALALTAALCIAVGDVLQQRAAHAITDDTVGHVALLTTLLRNRRWWLGALLLIASIALQAAALSQGSVLLVQALLMTSVLFALPINARLLHRAMTGNEWIWAGLLTVAVTVIVVLGNPQAGRSSAPLQVWAVVACILGPLLAICVVAGRIWGGAVAAVLFALVSGSLWGLFAVLTKEVMARLGSGLVAVIEAPALYACLLAAGGGVLLSQSAFRAGPLTASMPALQVSQPLVAAVLGVVVLDESLNTSRAGMTALEVAAMVTAVSIYRLARVDAAVTHRQVAEIQSAVG
jgi:drug/metabolite transporter (DMT)-like permease